MSAPSRYYRAGYDGAPTLSLEGLWRLNGAGPVRPRSEVIYASGVEELRGAAYASAWAALCQGYRDGIEDRLDSEPPTDEEVTP